MRKIIVLFVVIYSLLCLGCSTQWAERWAALPAEWSEPITNKSPALGQFMAIQTGRSGYRFQSTMAWVTGFPRDVLIDISDGQVLPVHWYADQKAMWGYLARFGAIYELWLVTDRLTIRQASEYNMILMTNKGEIALTLPIIDIVYDLDVEKWVVNKKGASDALCVAAEAAILANNEMKLLRKDTDAGRITNAEANSLQAELAPLLANSVLLCR